MDDLVKLLAERAASYGALRQSSLTAIALDRASAALTAAQAREAADKARIAELEAALSEAYELAAQVAENWRINNDPLIAFPPRIAAAIRNLKGTEHD